MKRSRILGCEIALLSCLIFLAVDGGVTELYELGAGKVLTGLAKRIAPETAATAVNRSHGPGGVRSGI